MSHRTIPCPPPANDRESGEHQIPGPPRRDPLFYLDSCIWTSSALTSQVSDGFGDVVACLFDAVNDEPEEALERARVFVLTTLSNLAKLRECLTDADATIKKLRSEEAEVPRG